jgi:hypothetical protein
VPALGFPQLLPHEVTQIARRLSAMTAASEMRNAICHLPGRRIVTTSADSSVRLFDLCDAA